MNWFTFLKLSSPVVERDLYNGPNYLEIGHDDDMGDKYKIYIWYIDNNWKIYSHESKQLLADIKRDKPDFSFDYAAHDDLGHAARDPNRFIARGRYVERPEGNVASYSLSRIVGKQGLFAERKYREKVEGNLDRTFDSPEIYSF